MPELGRLRALLGEVRRRTLGGLLLEQASVAVLLGLGAACVLVVVGTQILDWYWPALLAAGSLAVGLWRVRRRMPADYVLAQRLDRRLALEDTLSTAWYFAQSNGARRAAPEMLEGQRAAAERAAASIDARAAVPVAMPRTAYATLGCTLLFCGLLTVRYGLRRDLSLEQPLVKIPFNLFWDTPREVAQAKKGVPRPALPPELQGIAVPAEDAERAAGEERMPGEEGLTPITAEGRQAGKKAKTAGKESEESGDVEEGQEPGGERGGDARNQPGAASPPEDRGAGNAASKGGEKPPPPQNEENSSLMDKMRDAMANMLARLKMSPKAGEGSSRQAPSKDGTPQSASNRPTPSDKGQPAPGKPRGEGKDAADQEGDQEGEGSDKTLSAQGKGGDKSSQTTQEGKTGIGKQDGEKEIAEAAQQEAMGKISELLGKRSEKMQGEMMLEVGSGKQQLKTPYAQSRAAHAEAGGEIGRDEVPFELQPYVEQYFREVRKAAAGQGPAAGQKK